MLMRIVDRVEVEYRSPDELAGWNEREWRDVLALVRLSSTEAVIDAAGGPSVIQVAVPVLGTAATVFEVWRTAGSLESGRDGRVRHRSNGALLFGSVEVSERDAPRDLADGTPLEWATALAYREIIHCLGARGFPHLWRVWNYLPEINCEAAGSERYRLFNLARRRAFGEAAPAIGPHIPAACALGLSPQSPLVVYFLAGVRGALPIENPRQVPAYRYPPQYGPASPMFSRATLAGDASGATLLISGTSSIVGHRSVHAGDVVAQTRETLDNIRALLEEANRRVAGVGFTPEQLAYKVYLRYARDLHACAAELRGALGPEVPMVHLRADICRSDLLVEIEAVGHWRQAL